jgi:hypothetical protein
MVQLVRKGLLVRPGPRVLTELWVHKDQPARPELRARKVHKAKLELPVRKAIPELPALTARPEHPLSQPLRAMPVASVADSAWIRPPTSPVAARAHARSLVPPRSESGR